MHDAPPLPSHKEKAVDLPGVVLALIGVFVAIHLWRSTLSGEADVEWLSRLAFVPGRFTYAFDPQGVAAAFDVLARAEPDQAAIGRYFLGDGRPNWASVLTYAFLHGDWAHLGFNALWLFAFGAAVARRFGAARFLALGAAAAIGGAAMHWAFHRFGLQPVIGASAAVSGAMAAAARFAFNRAPPGQGRFGDAARHGGPALSLSEMARQRGPMMFLVVWFASNLVFGLAGQAIGLSAAPVAWEAHMGGFLVGLLGFDLFDPKRTIGPPQ